MKFEEIFESMRWLFESFDTLDRVYADAVASLSPSLQRDLVDIERLIINKARSNSIRSTSVIELYKILVRSNAPFPKHSVVGNVRDASEWVRVLRAGSSEGVFYFLTAIDDSLDEVESRKEMKENKDNFAVVHRGSGYTIFRPHHRGAACSLGSNTKWCISSRTNNHFDSYSEENYVYIIRTNNGQKFAIIISKADGSIDEVQVANNEYSDPNTTILNRFAGAMEDAGVNVDELEHVLNITLRDSNDDSVIGVKEIRFEVAEGYFPDSITSASNYLGGREFDVVVELDTGGRGINETTIRTGLSYFVLSLNGRQTTVYSLSSHPNGSTSTIGDILTEMIVGQSDVGRLLAIHGRSTLSGLMRSDMVRAIANHDELSRDVISARPVSDDELFEMLGV